MTKLELTPASLVLIAKFGIIQRLSLVSFAFFRGNRPIFILWRSSRHSLLTSHPQWVYGMRLALHAAADTFRGNQVASPRSFG